MSDDFVYFEDAERDRARKARARCTRLILTAVEKRNVRKRPLSDADAR